MLRSLFRRGLDVQERRVGVPLDYARFMLQTSLGAFVKYALIMPFASHRRALPADEVYAARLVATLYEDCGSCLQIVVNLARKDGVPRELIQAVLAGRADGLSDAVADVCDFTQSVLSPGGGDSAARERIRQRHGDAGLVDLALAIASARVFPTTKRALGYAVSCSRVQIDL